MFVCNGSPIGLRLRPASLNILNSLGITALQLILSWGLLYPSQALPIDCYVLSLLFPILLLTVPCVLSLINYCYIRYASTPKAY
jgi:hypothetical protein